MYSTYFQNFYQVITSNINDENHEIELKTKVHELNYAFLIYSDMVHCTCTLYV